MSLSATAAERLRDETEAALTRVVGRVMRAYVSDVRHATLSAVRSGTALTAASAPAPEPLPDGEIPGLGAQAGRWAAGVDAYVLAAIQSEFSTIYAKYEAGSTVTSAAEQAMEAYTSKVRDRLVRGTHMGVTVYDESFDAVRRSLAQSTVQGWSRQELAKRIAAELDWDGDSRYWNAAKSSYSAKIDALLDPLGEPGSPAREYARLNDPGVANLREQMNLATKHLDNEQSIWQTRSMLIARTESTGVANFGAHQALVAEGTNGKVWVATNDSRTRPSHDRADGQKVAIDAEFIVGGAAMQHPGDPSAPVEETANCRCTMIGDDIEERD